MTCSFTEGSTATECLVDIGKISFNIISRYNGEDVALKTTTIEIPDNTGWSMTAYYNGIPLSPEPAVHGVYVDGNVLPSPSVATSTSKTV